MEDLAESVIEYFTGKGIKVTYQNSCFEISAFAGEQEYTFVCLIDDNFPYVLPKIKLGEAAKQLLSGRPHVFIGGYLCTYGSDVVLPNFYRPDMIIIETIEKAISMICDTNQEKDEEAFNDEFKAYWEGNIKDKIGVDLFVDDLSVFQVLFCITNEKSIIAANSSDKVISIAKNALKYDEDHKDIFTAILVPIVSFNDAISASTQRNWLDIIKTHSSAYDQYCLFLRKNSKKSFLVIFTLEVEHKWIPCGFTHSALGDHPSFENGTTPVSLVLMGSEGDKLIERVKVRDCSQNRLFTRGGIGKLFPISEVAIVGCGSLGSHLANLLADCGINHFSLFDYDSLSVDNIARHLCGYFHVDRLKTSAIEFYLRLKNPNISCVCTDTNIHTVLRSSIELLNNCDAIFITTADISVDAHIISCLCERIITKPLIIMWFEPYAIAAHVIVLQKPQDIFAELYDGQFNYKYSVLQHAADYQKRDSGCQATYVQYSSLHVEMFACAFLDYFFSNNIFLTNSNYRFLWLGSYGIAEKFNLELNDQYKDLQWNTLYCETISDD